MNTIKEVKNHYAREFAGSTPWGGNFKIILTFLLEISHTLEEIQLPCTGEERQFCAWTISFQDLE